MESPRVVLVAGEASGDVHGGELLEHLRQLVPGVKVSGIGGERLRQAGMDTLVDYASISTMGLVETLGSLRQLTAAYRRLRRLLREKGAELLILIDFPEFNLALARVAQRLGIPVFYYVSPQVWAWRRRRVKKIARRASRLAVVFPFEPAYYEGTGAEVEFVGHPLVDRVQVTRPREDTLRAHGLDPARQTVLLMPGSRPRELSLILPPLVEAAKRLARYGSYQFLLCLAPTFTSELVAQSVRSLSVPVTISSGDTYNLLHAADLALVASGTAALEAALVGTPMVIVYKLSVVTYMLARMLVRIPFIGMPNIVAGSEIVPELIQGQASGAGIAREALTILKSEEKRTVIKAELSEVRRKLGMPGAAKRAAGIAAEMLKRAKGIHP